MKSIEPGPRLRFPGLAFEDWGEQTYLQREIENNAQLLKVDFVDLACLDRNRANTKYAFWHMAGSNIKGELDAHISKDPILKKT